MDPNETLAQIRALRNKMEGGLYPPAMLEAATELHSLVGALDDWLSSGGFPPEAWQRDKLAGGTYRIPSGRRV